MIEKMKITAKTVEEAIKKAADIWKIDAVKNGYTVIQEPSRGIFGIGSKDAIIEVNKNVPAQEEEPKAVETPAAPKTAPVEQAPSAAPAESPAPAEAVEEETTIVVEELSAGEKIASLDDIVPEAVSQADAQTGDAESIGLAFLAPIFKALDVEDAVVHVTEDDTSIRFDISGERVGILIGRHGETLNALQFLLSLVINGKLENHRSVIFDVENYRERQADKLENLAKRMAEKCRRTHRRVVLSPMNAGERRIIHITIENQKGVSSYSEGNEPHRRVVIVED